MTKRGAASQIMLRSKHGLRHAASVMTVESGTGGTNNKAGVFSVITGVSVAVTTSATNLGNVIGTL